MGDVSNEPSMEDILSSIKRIIAEEGESATAARTRRPARAAPAPVVEDEILELSEPVPSAPPAAASKPAPVEAPVTVAAPTAEPILSATTAEATRGPLEQLSRMVVKPPEATGDNTLEGLVREMLRPMLRDWLDANLPRMVEEMVQREISRITSRG
jgi:cell pole-organizing protein PopZ